MIRADGFDYAVLRAGGLRVGVQVLTPAHRWETITRLDRGDTYVTTVAVTTDATGPDYPWTWVVGHQLLSRWPVSAAAPLAA